MYTNQDTPEIAEFVQLCMALAFIPEAEIEEKFAECINELSEQNRDILVDFINYFQDTWVDGLFRRSMWNKYGKDYLHLTNNRVEVWHSTLKKKLPIDPNIFVFIDALKSIQSGAQLTMQKADAGESPAKRRQKYINFENAIQKLHRKHETGKINTTALLRRAIWYKSFCMTIIIVLCNHIYIIFGIELQSSMLF